MSVPDTYVRACALADVPEDGAIGVEVQDTPVAIIQDHGGTIRATSAGPGQGSRFIVTLPALAKQGLTDADAKPAVDHTHA